MGAHTNLTEVYSKKRHIKCRLKFEMNKNRSNTRDVKRKREAFCFPFIWVTKGSRTPDLRNHNPTL
jgi:hypothetical protein